MTTHLRAVALASALAMGPLAASAVTVVADGGSYDLLADSYFFNGNFAIGDSGDVYTFEFFNSSDTLAALTDFGATVIQTSAAFARGVSIQFGDLAPLIVAPNSNASFEQEFVVGAGETVEVVLSFSRIVDTGPRRGGRADVEFAIEAAVVPVPAGGVLLMSALGGIALARRRKARAA